MLDYVIWVCGEMRQLGFHSGAERDHWCSRVERAYRALFVPMVPNFGDPYPPDVPPARNPGIWPDVPAAGLAGMTLRHQLVVIGQLALRLRDQPWHHLPGQQLEEFDRRLSIARQAIDHGAFLAVPEDAWSQADPEVLAKAEADRALLKKMARKRAREIRKQLRERQAAKKAAKKTASSKSASARKKTATGKKKAAAARKKTAKGKKTAGSSPKQSSPKKSAPKKGARKKTAAGKKKVARKKATQTKGGKTKAAKKKASKTTSTGRTSSRGKKKAPARKKATRKKSARGKKR